MLDKNDLKAIGSLIDEKMDKKIDQFAIIMANSFAAVQDQIGGIAADVTVLKTDVSELKTGQNNLRQEFDSFRTETRHNFERVFSEISEIKIRLTRLEKRTLEDSDVAASEIIELKKRVDFLEKQFNKLQRA